ncbi:MAG: helix-turn-helix domain-containing protein [Microbacterium arborescens]
MPATPDRARFLAPAQVAEILQIEVDEVIALLVEGSLGGAKLGSPPRWRVEYASIEDYLAARVEDARRSALWQQSQLASFPELWGRRRPAAPGPQD